MILRARAVLPIAQPPIPDGAVLLAGGRIRQVGPWRELAGTKHHEVLDLGEVVLLPGLLNAHCHLDYTLMAGQLPPPKVFSDWLKLIIAIKSTWNDAEYLRSWRCGAQMLLRSGTTTVADMEAIPQLLPGAWKSTPLRVFSFLEMIGLRNQRTAQTILQETLERIGGLRHGRCRAGLSPHAPYTTRPELLRLSARAAARRRWPLCIHVAESALEFEMFAHGRGEMFEWLERSGRDMSDCGLGSPVAHLERCGALSSRLVATHVNYLGRGDLALLARRRVNVVHCPRSHFYFNHEPFRLRRLSQEGVNVCLGTDSLASVYKSRGQSVELNLFDEMRLLAEREPWLSPQKIVEMATVNGAKALGLGGKAGALTAGAFADLIALPWSGKLSQVYGTVLEHRGPVEASMIEGKWAIAPGGAWGASERRSVGAGERGAGGASSGRASSGRASSGERGSAAALTDGSERKNRAGA